MLRDLDETQGVAAVFERGRDERAETRDGFRVLAVVPAWRWRVADDPDRGRAKSALRRVGDDPGRGRAGSRTIQVADAASPRPVP